MASAAEAEVGALFENTQLGVPLRNTLVELGHPQPATPVQTDNTTACDIISNKVKQKRTRAMDMRFYWVRDRHQQNQFKIFWRPGENNYGDYFTKQHSPTHHKNWRYKFLTAPGDEVCNSARSSSGMRGCIDSNPGCEVTPGGRNQCFTADYYVSKLKHTFHRILADSMPRKLVDRAGEEIIN